MKTFTLLTALALATLVVMPQLNAQTTEKFPEAAPVVSATFPEGWTLKQKEDNYIEMESPESAIDFDLWTMKAEDVDKSMDEVLDNMKSWLTDIKLDKSPASDFTINGISFTAFTGTGMPSKEEDKSHGQQEIELYMASADGGKTLTVMIYYGDKGAADKYKEDLRFIVNSIKPITE